MHCQYTLHSAHSLEELIRGTLARHLGRRQCRLEVCVDDGEVTLKGTLPTWYDKQLAQESLRYVDGVASIRNQIAVVS